MALVREAEEAARRQDEKLLRQVTVGYADTIQQVTIANTEGVYVEDERVRCRMSVNAVAAEGTVIQTGYDSIGGTRGVELFDGEKPADLRAAGGQEGAPDAEGPPGAGGAHGGGVVRGGRWDDGS